MARQVRSAPDIPDMEVLRQIGGGSYGEIWMARSVTDTMRAVKVVYRNDFDDDRTFEREFEGILKYEPVAREHPGLVDILHVGRDKTGDEEFYFYVMELGDDVERGSQISPADYEPRTLRSDTLRAGKRPLSVSFCAEAGERLAGALAHLHEKGLAHRDVKPSNVIFVNGQACLADIGLVAARDQRTFVGTEGFVPPEGPGSAGADVYALGKVLYEMATGKDRLDFPELPDEPIPKADTKRWLALNKVICETCDPRPKKRQFNEAADLERVLGFLHRSRRIRRKKAPLGLAVTTILIAAGLAAAVVFSPSSLKILSSRKTEENLPTRSFLTVISEPDGADVYDDDGVFLGATPYGPKEFPIGAEVKYTLRYPGHEAKEISAILKQTNEVVLGSLNRYPPEPGIEWRDFLGQRYFPEDESHLSAYLVGAIEFRHFMNKQDKSWRNVDVRENGIRRRVVFVMPEQGQKFVHWLANQSEADGVTKESFRFEAVFENEEDVQGGSEEIWDEGFRPLRVRVTPIQKGRLDFETEPTRAFVYLNGSYLGTTPLKGVELFPGEAVLRAELDGYEEYETKLQVKENERITLPLITLAQTKGMPWQLAEWKNSLGMEFVEVDSELLVARWETRVKDFREYVSKAKKKRLENPDFRQDGDHPVVNVTRDDAISFCAWLTEREQKRGRIREWHYYRLPTDGEWSRMVGAELEPGDNPVERARWEWVGFPWGEQFPPEEKVVNIAGEEVSAFEPLTRLVESYRDGYVATSPVGSFAPNALGIHDLGGNVREWVSDFYASDEAFGTTRGGSWKDYLREHLRTSFRRPVNGKSEALGFRIVLAKLEQTEEYSEEDDG